MNKNNLVILTVAAIALILGLIYYEKSSKNTDIKDSAVQTENSEKSSAPETNISADTAPQNVVDEGPNPITMNAPENAMQYVITEGTVMYTADKLWLKKPHEKIDGKSENIQGRGWFDETGKGQIEVNLDFSTIKSPSPLRDKDLNNNYLSSKEVKFIADIDNPKIKIGQDFKDVKVNGKLTLNGVTKDVIFNVNGKVDKDNVMASGTSRIKLGDYNIKTPSLLEVYTVSEDIDLKFDVKGQKL